MNNDVFAERVRNIHGKKVTVTVVGNCTHGSDCEF